MYSCPKISSRYPSLQGQECALLELSTAESPAGLVPLAGNSSSSRRWFRLLSIPALDNIKENFCGYEVFLLFTQYLSLTQC